MVHTCAGRRWRHQEVWLHVDVDNTAAVAMYQKAGFVAVKRERERVPPFHMRFLMKKAIPQAATHAPAVPHTGTAPASTAEPAEAPQARKKVFVWEESDG